MMLVVSSCGPRRPSVCSAPSGFSLIELLVATLCTALLCAAVLTLLVGSAEGSRREWAVLAARRAANAAVAALARDLGRAGVGLEGADAVSLGGSRIPFAASEAGGRVRVVLPLGRAREIRSYDPVSGYLLDAAAGLAVGATVAAVDQPDRPAGASLPVGTVFVAGTVASGVAVRVAWGGAEAATVASWGPPRALLPVLVREYSTRGVGGKLQLDRSNDGGPRQPVVDGLDELRIEWLVDTDSDGRADASRAVAAPSSTVRLCAARIVAGAKPLLRRTVGGREAAAVEQASRWVGLSGC